MKYRYFMIASAVAYLGFGLPFLFAAEFMMNLFGMPLSPGVARVLGASYIGYGVLNWQARSAEDSELRRAIILSNFVIHLISLPVTLIGLNTGLVNSLGWAAAGFHLVFGLGFAYYLWKPKAA
jgi:pilus assembly protein TadC